MQTAYVALGAQRYRVERNWAQADLGSLCSVAVLADGRVAALLRRPAAVIVLEPDGRLAAQWPLADLLCPHHISARPGAVRWWRTWTAIRSWRWTGTGASSGGWASRAGRAGRSRSIIPPMRWNGRTAACGSATVTAIPWCTASMPDAAGWAPWASPGMAPCSSARRTCWRARRTARCWWPTGRIIASSAWTARAATWASCVPCTSPWRWPSCRRDVLVSDQTARLSRFSAQDGRLIGRCRIQGVYGHGLAAGVDGCIHVAEMLPDCLTRLRPD